LLQAIQQAQLERVCLQALAQLIQAAFQREDSLGGAVAAELPAFGAVGVNGLGIGLHGLPGISAAAGSDGIVGDPEAGAVVTAGVGVDVHLDTRQAPVGAGAGFQADMVGVSFGSSVEDLPP
jgi:hypothetical protein